MTPREIQAAFARIRDLTQGISGLRDERTQAVVDLHANGISVNTIASETGIARSTLYSFLARGKN